MECRLDLNSPEMGFWVDRWLHNLRQTGRTPRELLRLVRELAAASNGDASKSATMAQFMDFVQGQQSKSIPLQ